MRPFIYFTLFSVLFCFSLVSCKKKDTLPTPPKADFIFTVSNAGLLPTNVDFTSTSTNATSYSWSFGDGQSSTNQTTSHQYTVAGTYDVTLIIVGSGGNDKITKTVVITQDKPKSSFSFSIVDNGNYPVHVNFTNTTIGASSYKWYFDNGDVSSLQNPVDSFFTVKKFNVKLVATNVKGSDSTIQAVTININKPTPLFTYTIINPQNLPLNISTANTSTVHSTYLWDFGDGSTSVAVTPNHTYTTGGIYTISLTATNPGGSTSITQEIRVSPYQQSYKSFDGTTYNLYAWEGKTIMLLMRTPNLNAKAMFNWAKIMDNAYDYYKTSTGQFPSPNPNVTYINNHVTIADVATTCGAGCGYLGATGIEMLNSYTDRMYSYALSNQYDQELFYECGRNFWYYSNQLAYKANDPIVTGYAVFMRFMSMDATGVMPAPFNSTPWTTFRAGVEGLVDSYTTNSSYNWNNTLGLGAGIANPLGLGATDLFASFCIRLRRDYGGEPFVQNLWKQAGLRPAANTTQDAVDNFILAACAAANKNLTSLFITTWRWPMSANAQKTAATYP